MDITSTTLIRPLFMSKPNTNHLDDVVDIVNPRKALDFAIKRREILNINNSLEWDNIKADFIRCLNTYITAFNKNPSYPYFVWLDDILIFNYHNGYFENGDKISIEGLPPELEIMERENIDNVKEQVINSFRRIETIDGQLILVFLDVLHKQEPIAIVNKNSW